MKPENKKYYLYKITDKNDVTLYVGQTSNIDNRIRDHVNSRSWIEEGYKFYTYECCNKTNVDIYEIYYINKLKAFYNKENSNNRDFTIELEDINFKLYQTISTLDLKYRNEERGNKSDKNSSNYGIDVLRRVGFVEENDFKNVQFFTGIFESKTISLISFTFLNDIEVSLMFDGGLHKLFEVNKSTDTFPLWHNLEVFLHTVRIAADNDVYDKEFKIRLDNLDFSMYKLVNKEDADILSYEIKSGAIRA